MKKRRLLFAVSLIIIGLIIGLSISIKLDIQKVTLAEQSSVSTDTREFLERFNRSLSEIADAVKPSVVNISTTKTVTMQSPFQDFFKDPLFRRFFDDNFDHFGKKRKFRSSSLGSGVIVAGEGYILTNNHVVRDADEIQVTLYDNREFKGKVIGTDPKSDLAVIKINAGGLPAIRIGESDRLKVGEVVMAIGNPFGLNHTITMGIVSAVGRSNVGIADYEDFIQTDAAINPGNSGGALVNIKGELVGINTAIFSTSGGYMGIGFAIPSNMAKSVMQSIVKHGKVIRGWLGVTIQDINPEIAKHFDIKEEKGSLVTDVVKDSPAEKAGFKRGDLIVEFDGRAVEDSSGLRNMVANTLPGKTVQVRIFREGKETILNVTLGEFPEKMAALRGAYSNALNGVNVQELTAELKKNLGIPEEIKGLIVTNVSGESPASGVLRQNDIILEVNKRTVRSLNEYEDVVSKIGSNDSILLLVYRAGSYLYITIKP